MQTTVNYGTRPKNFAIVDRFVSRSAQPLLDDLRWIKMQRVTDVVNFRTMAESGINFDEKRAAESLGMKYHNIPSVTAQPQEKNVIDFLKLVEQIKAKRGKVHIHCKAGADRTGMYSFIYKGIQRIGNNSDNIKEWLDSGHNRTLYPKLIPWAENVLKHLKKQSR